MLQTAKTVGVQNQPLIGVTLPDHILNLSLIGLPHPFSALESAHFHPRTPVGTILPVSVSPELVEMAVERDSFAIPTTEDREGYHGERHFDWWLSGLRDYYQILSEMNLDISIPHPDLSVLELGCASGRVIRHFSAQAQCGCWAVDLNLRHVEWVRQFLSEKIRVLHNTILPTLPIPDASIDICCAFSVFTHVDYYEGAWIAELARILKPGGIAYLSLHTELTWSSLKPGVRVYDDLVEANEYLVDVKICPELFEQPMPRDKMVFTVWSAKNYNCNVFVRRDYIRSYWGRFLKVLKFIDRGHDYQDVVVLQKV